MSPPSIVVLLLSHKKITLARLACLCLLTVQTSLFFLLYRMHSHNSRSPLEVWTEHGIQVLNRVFVRGIPNKV